jgi:hypothetical protein
MEAPNPKERIVEIIKAGEKFRVDGRKSLVNLSIRYMTDEDQETIRQFLNENHPLRLRFLRVLSIGDRKQKRAINILAQPSGLATLIEHGVSAPPRGQSATVMARRECAKAIEIQTKMDYSAKKVQH